MSNKPELWARSGKTAYEHHAMLCGWQFPHVMDEVLAKWGCPVGKEREAALALYYNAPPRRSKARAPGYTMIKTIISNVYWTLRLAERDEWWYFAPLTNLQLAYVAGYTPAVKHAYRYCKQTEMPMQPWIVQWTEGILDDASRIPPPPKKKPGRHKGAASEEFMANLSTFVQVNFWCQQVCGVYRSGKPHWISPAIAYEIVNNTDFRHKKRDRSVHAIAKSYRLTLNTFLRALCEMYSQTSQTRVKLSSQISETSKVFKSNQ
jgi:hypothetical protein